MHSEGRYGVERGLVGWWRLMDANEGVNDIIGTNDGTLNGGMGYGSGGGRRYAVFDGVDDYVSIAEPAVSGLTQMTLCSWVRVNGVSAGKYASIACSSGGPTYYWGLLFYASGINQFLCVMSGSTNAYRYADGQFTLGVFAHFAMVFDGSLSASSRISMFVNGAAVTGATDGTTPPATVPSVGANFSPCHPHTASQVYGNLDVSDVRIYNRALSAAEVARLARIY